MQAEALFWGIAVLLVLGSVGLVFAPLLRGAGRAGRRSSYDMRIYRDQLREIDADLARGTLTETEAKASKLEISRRLLAAADSEAAENAAVTAPRGLSRATAGGLGLALLAATAGIYVRLGAPGVSDLPLSLRLEQEAKARANRPSQAEAETLAGKPKSPGPQTASPQDLALVQKLQDVLKTRPDDLQGHVLLVRSLGALGRWQEARVAQGDVVRIEGDKVTAQDLVALAELMILATNGYVSPEAETALGHALTLDPNNPLGRYYSGLTLLQGGRPDLAYGLWSRLLAEGPADAPWIPTIKAQIGEVAGLAGMPPLDESTAGPDQAQVDAAGAMTPEQRQTMIDGMVTQLSTRLSTKGGTAAEWSQLIRAYGVQGRMDDAAKAWTEAKAAHASDPAAMATLAAAAREAGLTN